MFEVIIANEKSSNTLMILIPDRGVLFGENYFRE
jgi:hypothetical protein